MRKFISSSVDELSHGRSLHGMACSVRGLTGFVRRGQVRGSHLLSECGEFVGKSVEPCAGDLLEAS